MPPSSTEYEPPYCASAYMQLAAKLPPTHHPNRARNRELESRPRASNCGSSMAKSGSSLASGSTTSTQTKRRRGSQLLLLTSPFSGCRFQSTAIGAMPTKRVQKYTASIRAGSRKSCLRSEESAGPIETGLSLEIEEWDAHVLSSDLIVRIFTLSMKQSEICKTPMIGHLPGQTKLSFMGSRHSCLFAFLAHYSKFSVIIPLAKNILFHLGLEPGFDCLKQSSRQDLNKVGH